MALPVPVEDPVAIEIGRMEFEAINIQDPRERRDFYQRMQKASNMKNRLLPRYFDVLKSYLKQRIAEHTRAHSNSPQEAIYYDNRELGS